MKPNILTFNLDDLHCSWFNRVFFFTVLPFNIYVPYFTFEFIKGLNIEM